jgi:DNA-binding cell septation regulator SpoVG
MDALILNFKAYSSGAMIGWFDLAVSGLVITGCKAFRKENKVWFAMPSEKSTGDAGDTKYRDIVTAAAPGVMAHLQNAVRDKLRATIKSKTASLAPRSAQPAPAKPKPTGSYRTPEGQDLSEYRSPSGDDGIRF